jgi:hypothetical protein
MLPANNYRVLWTNAELYILDEPSELINIFVFSQTQHYIVIQLIDDKFRSLDRPHAIFT